MESTDFLEEFEALRVEPSSKRRLCNICRRPITVCWCQYLPKEPIITESTVVVLQHPSEEKQCLRTAPILVAGLSRGKCHVIRGRKFSPARNIFEIKENDTILLYPGKDAVDIRDLLPVSKNGKPYTLLLIDGTWSQAKSLYHNSPYLQQLRQVKLNPSHRSEYVIKTQPAENCLSTVESAALALCILEEKPYINELLIRPLQALCEFQIQHGAVEHRSKEFKVLYGPYSEPLPRKLKKKRNRLLRENGTLLDS